MFAKIPRKYSSELFFTLTTINLNKLVEYIFIPRCLNGLLTEYYGTEIFMNLYKTGHIFVVISIYKMKKIKRMLQKYTCHRC